MLELMELSADLLHLRVEETRGWMLLVMFVGVGVATAWRQQRKRPHWPSATVMFVVPTLLGLVLLYFMARTLELRFDRARGEAQIVETTAFGNRTLDHRFELAQVAAVDVRSERPRDNVVLYFLVIELADGTEIALKRAGTNARVGAEAEAERIRSFLFEPAPR